MDHICDLLKRAELMLGVWRSADVTCSAVLWSVSGFRDLESIPSSTSHLANSG